MESIISSCITGFLALAGIIITNAMSNRRIEHQLETAQAVTDFKIEELTKHVEKHNNVIERMYNLEKKADVLEEKMSVANHRLTDLENKN